MLDHRLDLVLGPAGVEALAGTGRALGVRDRETGARGAHVNDRVGPGNLALEHEPSHPEDDEASGFDRSIETGPERQRQHVADRVGVTPPAAPETSAELRRV